MDPTSTAFQARPGIGATDYADSIDSVVIAGHMGVVVVRLFGLKADGDSGSSQRSDRNYRVGNPP